MRALHSLFEAIFESTLQTGGLGVIERERRPSMDEASTPTEHFTELTSGIVSAYVSKNNVPTGDLPALIASVHGALSQLNQPQHEAAPKHEPPMP